MASKSFKDLIVWQKARQWVLGIYHFTDCFPSSGDTRVLEKNLEEISRLLEAYARGVAKS